MNDIATAQVETMAENSLKAKLNTLCSD